MNRFRAAVEARDHEAFPALFAENIAFFSPVAPPPFTGRDRVATILRAAFAVLEDFRYERELASDDARDVALPFQARIGALPAQGCDFLHLDDHGLIDRFIVMLRPLPAVEAMAEAMSAQRR